MPELAEVDFFRKQWNPGVGKAITRVELNATKRVFRGCDAKKLARQLIGRKLAASRSHGKQMLFEFSGGLWMRLHLGMTGHLRSGHASENRSAHDHLVIRSGSVSLFFRDPRQFGEVRWEIAASLPSWWHELPPEILSPAFNVARVETLARRRARTPIKAVLLMQERFPGVGNWMADEILWRGRIHPQRVAGSLRPDEVKRIWKETKWVARRAMATIATDMCDPPKSWLFRHRWTNGVICPRDGAGLQRDEIGGRTSCWCPQCQPS
jgi:formamidopyrimidine-DNA glycosylase